MQAMMVPDIAGEGGAMESIWTGMTHGSGLGVGGMPWL
jgi:hypothetical protein